MQHAHETLFLPVLQQLLAASSGGFALDLSPEAVPANHQIFTRRRELPKESPGLFVIAHPEGEPRTMLLVLRPTFAMSFAS